MASFLLAALLAAAPSSAASVAAPSLDRLCFQLMAEMAEHDDARIRDTSRVAAQYFLGRLDAATPGGEADTNASDTGGDRNGLLRRCGEAMQAGGRDFRAIGEALVPGSRPSA